MRTVICETTMKKPSSALDDLRWSKYIYNKKYYILFYVYDIINIWSQYKDGVRESTGSCRSEPCGESPAAPLRPDPVELVLLHRAEHVLNQRREQIWWFIVM